ncbi:N-acetylmuramoyl-L-alanine amidase [Gemmobacter denitrificans]|uniref:1,6-anhydro-N-acetylmuramyl-L-alanine amidase AmpD n=1 Tax=Gemmobacter denitrificans TaxID=3123040 RepID=A0ABU8C089_9RHOB
MKLKNHRIEGIPFLPARLTGGTITPEIVILHDTAGRLDKFNSRDYLARTTKASVHFVIERDGTVSQLVPTNRRAGHAGQSSYHGRPDCNAFSIGIEIVNPGRMTRGAGGSVLAWWGQDFGPGGQIGGYGLADLETPEHGRGTWMAYAPEQIEAVEALLLALFATIPSLRDITTHWYVSPGRKVDVNPLFPLEAIRARVLGRDDPALQAANAGSTPEAPGAFVQVEAAAGLNLRSWPSFNPNVITSIPGGTRLPVNRQGSFSGRQWLNVTYSGRDGWIVAAYTQPIPPSA